MHYTKKILFTGLALLGTAAFVKAQTMDKMWDKTSSSKTNHNNQWFRAAKFGMFIHWGLYSNIAGEWKNKPYYGSGEWIMWQAKIPAKEYAATASNFNPTHFNADQWAQLAEDAGIKYMVITAKHHEGFAMYNSKISDFNIVKSTPYKKDPMQALSVATRKRGIKFGFYYSQFLDWHEPNGGGNSWDFEENKKDYLKYYKEKSIPQLKELLTQYGPLGILWFDMPGGLSKQETQQLIDTLHQLQPTALFSSRVGQGLGDYTDFGDSELPTKPIDGPWESIYTHNDSWGYIKHDMNFKSSSEIIQLLANVASKGGNLMLNIGPDGKGEMPYYSIKYLKETGTWLKKNGESIYGTTYGFIPAQPWGVTTAKPGKLFLHIFNKPLHGKILVPHFNRKIAKVYTCVDKKTIPFNQKNNDLVIDISSLEKEKSPNLVLVVAYEGTPPSYDDNEPITISSQYEKNPVEAVFAKTKGESEIKTFTFSHYFGDWKYATCVSQMKNSTDSVTYNLRFVDKGDYKIVLEYACDPENAKQEGVLDFNNQTYLFQTIRTAAYEKDAPLLFIKHPVAILTIKEPGTYTLNIHPLQNGKNLFHLKTTSIEPIQ